MADIVAATLTAVAMEAESGCSRCARRILLLEKAFLDERYAAVCIHCAADTYNELRQRTAMQGYPRLPKAIEDTARDDRYSDEFVGNALRAALRGQSNV
jgi:ribosomal protein L37E